MTKEITVNVSKKIGQANFSSAMLSASITMTVEEGQEVSKVYDEAWAICWEEIEKQEIELKDRSDIKESIQESDPTEKWPEAVSSAPPLPVRKCTACGAPMEFKSGTNKTGKPYKGWFCSDKTKSGHPVEWVR